MNRLVAFCLRHRGLTLVLAAAVALAGLIAFTRLNIEAYPDPVPPLVDVVTQSTGQSAEDIERYITIPIEIQMAGIPHVSSIRTVSLFGLSDVKVQFTYDFSYDEAEQRVINRLSQLPPLPNGALPTLSPESPIGEIYRYRVVGPPGYSITDLKTIQDWILERRFKAVPGVIDVSGWGGKTKTFDAEIDRDRMASRGVSVPQVITALNNANLNVGGQTVNIGAESAIVRGVGLIHTPEDIGSTLISGSGPTPVLLRDIADVRFGHLPRLGIAGQDDDDDIVQGIVLMHRGEKSTPTINAVKQEVDAINHSSILPPGVTLKTLYDRSQLIAVTTSTVLHNMAAGILLIFAIQWLFLGNLRSAVVVAATVPFALFFAVLIMSLRGESANLLSVGAVDFGLVVDATVILVEAIHRHLGQLPHETHQSAHRRARAALATIADAAAQVNRAIFFSAAIILASFAPLFSLSGVEGHIFGPMARTYAYAIAGGLLATYTLTPALSGLLMATAESHAPTALMSWLAKQYRTGLNFAISNRIITLGGAGAAFALAIAAGAMLGLEFLPHLEEGNYWIRATMPTAVSLEASNAQVNAMRRLLRTFPEVETVVSQHGRPDDGTDATGFFNAEFFVPLKPAADWPFGMTKAELTRQMNAALSARFPGVDFNFSQNIEDNVEEAASGVKGENSVKLFGPDLQTLEKNADRIKTVLGTVKGVTDLSVFASLGQPTIEVQIDRGKAALYGLTPSDINNTVQAAIGGQPAGALYENGSDRNFPIIVRYGAKDRQSLDSIQNLTIAAPNPGGGGLIQVPLHEVASVKLINGASFVYRENQERYVPIKFSVRGRDLGSAVNEAKAKIANSVALPGGYRVEWVGELGELNSALQRLGIVIPLSLLLIGLLLFVNFSSITDSLLAASVIPMALIGGVLILYITGTPLSISAAIGFIGLLGVSTMNGIMVLTTFNRMIAAGLERTEAVFGACETQLRPVLMTCTVACVGLLPAAVSTGIGSQVQRPLALVVVGGILLAPVFTLFVLPLLIDLFSRRGRRS